jgi:hypothetical protein
MPEVDFFCSIHPARERALLLSQRRRVGDHLRKAIVDAVAVQPNALRRGPDIDPRPVLGGAESGDVVPREGQIVRLAQDVDLCPPALCSIALDLTSRDVARVDLDRTGRRPDQDPGALVARDPAALDAIVAVTGADRDATVHVPGKGAPSYRDVVGTHAKVKARPAIALGCTLFKERARDSCARREAVTRIIAKAAAKDADVATDLKAEPLAGKAGLNDV